MSLERGRKGTWLVHSHEGQRQYLRVVASTGRVLVLDVPRHGKPHSRSMDFRAVRVAMPRLAD